jgi:hypothetical protein
VLIDQGIVGIADGPNAIYDGNAAAVCFDAIREAFASCNNFNGVDESEPACREVFLGTLPAGAECQDSIECARPADGTVSCSSDDLGVRRCDPHPLGVLGSSCEGTCRREGSVTSCSLGGAGQARCYTNDGLFCDETSGTCQALVPIGGGCSGFEGCVDGAFCDGTLCAARLPVGSACGFDDECVATAHCDAGACIARKPVGATCALDEECLGGSCTNGLCEDASAWPATLTLKGSRGTRR